MAGDAFNPGEFDAFKTGRHPGSGGAGFDPTEFEAFKASLPPLDPASASIGDLLTRSGQAREQGRQAGATAGVATTFGNGVQAGALANFNDEVAGLSRASGLPDWTPPIVAAPIGSGRMLLDAAGLTSGDATRAYEDQRDYVRGFQEAAHAAHPIADIAGEIGGGLALPLGNIRAGAGLTGAIKQGMATGAAYGAAAGAGAGEDATDRLTRAAIDGAVGAGIGGTLPVMGAVARPIVAPIASNITARINPAGYAERQVARAAERSGQAPEQVADRLGQAAAEGQGEYRLLDALDYPGARLGAVVTKNPGEGRTQLREFLNQRQEGQAYRVGNALGEGLNAPETAQAATARMTRARSAQDDQAFAVARRDAGPVDVAPVVSVIDDTLRPTGHLTDPNNIAYDSVEGVLARARRLLTDGEQSVSDFTVAQRARNDIADAVEVARRAGRGNQARLLRDVRNALDNQLQAASPSYRAAMADSAAAAREIEAVETGAASAGRGRTEDKIAAFNGLSEGERAAFRTGYADPLIAKVQGGAEGVNKARPFTSQAMQTELPAFAAPGRGDPMMRRLQRENEMFGNRAEALGNSKTAENLADNADTGIDPGLFAKVLGGNLVGATRELVGRGIAALNGNTEAVRREMARLLMEGDRNRVLTMLLRLGQEDARKARIGNDVRRGVVRVTIPALTGPREQAPTR